jgi:hypothetical protein
MERITAKEIREAVRETKYNKALEAFQSSS